MLLVWQNVLLKKQNQTNTQGGGGTQRPECRISCLQQLRWKVKYYRIVCASHAKYSAREWPSFALFAQWLENADKCGTIKDFRRRLTITFTKAGDCSWRVIVLFETHADARTRGNVSDRSYSEENTFARALRWRGSVFMLLFSTADSSRTKDGERRGGKIPVPQTFVRTWKIKALSLIITCFYFETSRRHPTEDFDAHFAPNDSAHFRPAACRGGAANSRRWSLTRRRLPSD